MDEKKFFYRASSRDLPMLENKKVYFSRPKLLAIYDIDHDKFSRAKNLKYFKRTLDYPIDLNKESEHFHQMMRSTDSKLFCSLLDALSEKQELTDDVERTAVITRRGLLETIMEFCYGRFDFKVLVSRCNGKIVMVRKEANEESQACSHHARLSQLLFFDSPDASCAQTFDQKSMDSNIFQLGIYQSTLGKFNISYDGRILGIDAYKKVEDITDLSLVRNQHFVMAKQMWSNCRNKDFKLLSYWVQAYLANVETLYLAYKEDEGIVRQPIESLKVCDIPKNCFWKPGICTAFLHDFLERVDRLMKGVDSMDTVYQLHFNAVDKAVYYTIHERDAELSFIPKEYAHVIRD